MLTDTTFRDAHQSLLATRVRTHDLLATAAAIAHRLPQLFSLEVWGGATFDTAMRFLREDPWQRLRELRERIPNICFQMLLRGANAVGYTAYPDNVIAEFIREAPAQGIDIFRIFDSLNCIANMRASIEAVLETGAVCEAAICYTGDMLDPNRPKYWLNYYVRMAKQMEKLGAHILCIKDMAGLCRPYAANQLVKALREEIGLARPFPHPRHQRHQRRLRIKGRRCRSGRGRRGHCRHERRHQPAQPEFHRRGLAPYAARYRPRYRRPQRMLRLLGNRSRLLLPFDSAPRAGSAGLYLHEMPGGQYTNLREQAAAMGLGMRWRDVERTYAGVNRLFGDIVKVTPSSKVVGDMALFLMAKDMRPEDVLRLDVHHDVSFPNSVVEMLAGGLGTPPGGWPEKVQEIILRGAKPHEGRPGAQLKSVDMDEAEKRLENQIGRSVRRDELLSYLLYPDVFLKYDKFRQAYADVSVLPTPPFFYGLRPDQEITVSIEAGKTLVIKFLAYRRTPSRRHAHIIFRVEWPA